MIQQAGSEHPRPKTNDPHEALAFIAGLTGELSQIARRHRFAALAYLLDMARLEAENLGRNVRNEAGEGHAQASETRPPA